MSELLRETSLRQVRKTVAKRLRVKPGTIDSWRRGVRCIPEEKIEPLVRALGHELPDGTLSPRGRNLVQTLKTARNTDEALSWKEQVDEGLYLQVEQARYLGADKFWGRIFFSFLDTADILHAKDVRSRNFHELQQAVWTGKLAVAMGILCTPQLNLKLWFFDSPIRYRLNCVVLSDVEGGTARVRAALRHPSTRKRLFIPIIMKGELGESFACRTLNLTNPVWVSSLSVKEFCDTLLNEAARSGERVPLIIVDEITCLSALVKLQGRARLVFPLVPTQEDWGVLKPPSFPLGLCLSRNERIIHARRGELMNFIRDALPGYIHGNAQSIALYYVALRRKIKRLVDLALPGSNPTEREAWLTRTFCLDRAALNLEPPHWRAVLEEAIAILQRSS